MSRYVLTGAPCTGKTSVIHALSKTLKVPLIPEVARPLIDFIRSYEAEKTEGEYLQKVIETLQLRDYMTYHHGVFDRGLPDQLAYREHLKIDIPQVLIERCNTYRYDKVFYFPFWPEIYKPDDVRTESLQEAEQLSDLIKLAYLYTGYKLITVPKVSVEERILFINKHIQR